MGVDLKGGASLGWTVADSLEELAQLADTAGLRVVGTTHQKLEHPNPKTYVGSGKINEIARAVEASGAETVVFDGEAKGRHVHCSDCSPLLHMVTGQLVATVLLKMGSFESQIQGKGCPLLEGYLTIRFPSLLPTIFRRQ